MTNHAYSKDLDRHSATAVPLHGCWPGLPSALPPPCCWLLPPAVKFAAPLARGFRSTLLALNRSTQQLRRRGANVIRFSRRPSLSGT